MNHYEDVRAVLYQRAECQIASAPRGGTPRSAGAGLPVYTFHVTPCPAPRMSQRDRWAKRPCVLRYFAYRDAVQAQAFEQAFRLPADLAVTFVLPMPASWSAKRRRLADGLAHQGRPDLDNLCKAFLDAMASEDGYVWRLRAEKRWGIKGKVVVGVHNDQP